jgi:hypothetical protein
MTRHCAAYQQSIVDGCTYMYIFWKLSQKSPTNLGAKEIQDNYSIIVQACR